MSRYLKIELLHPFVDDVIVNQNEKGTGGELAKEVSKRFIVVPVGSFFLSEIENKRYGLSIIGINELYEISREEYISVINELSKKE